METIEIHLKNKELESTPYKCSVQSFLFELFLSVTGFGKNSRNIYTLSGVGTVAMEDLRIDGL